MTKTKTKAETKSNFVNQGSSKKIILFGVLLILVACAMTIAFISFYFYWTNDHSVVGAWATREIESKNWLGNIGAAVSHFFLFQGFGLGSFFVLRSLFLSGVYTAFEIPKRRLRDIWFWDLYIMIMVSLIVTFVFPKVTILGGVCGFEIHDYFVDFLGKTGFGLILLLNLLGVLIFRFNITPKLIWDKIQPAIERWTFANEDPKDITEKVKEDISISSTKNHDKIVQEDTILDTPFPDQPRVSKVVMPESKSNFEIDKSSLKPTIEHHSEITTSLEDLEDDEDLNSIELKVVENSSTPAPSMPTTETIEVEGLVIEQGVEEQSTEENLAAKLVADFGEFDPTLDLSNFRFPTLDLLKDYPDNGITINQEELEENKNTIVSTLKNYKIDIAQIKATVGPSVTMYEIVPEAGIRISKIKNLEDDIALSLAALGIRIIAPIPGKGTIGIEVPNKKTTMVPMKSLISSKKFQEAEMELPIALGKTISNETFVVDLAKMPHMLMAGATGQGKSVGLNAVLTSLLYKKHPAEVKFVLVDPKKVELTLFNKIERHYLAKLPNSEEAIITDNTKVIHTLNSLCIEMDERYSLLKDAFVRNIKEYNEKFKQRRLNPENGHRFLPYIVLVVDEFADLIMTAGKEVETPIARLAQLARAIGIHLIIATQRPSVNVITGIIKANFPARVAFRVTSKIDSRTILDSPGADQLIGRGDLLFSNGNDVIRLQCAFVDTPEVEKITEYIGAQKAYPEAYLLPEYVGEDGGSVLDIDISERDSMFREAAEIIVTAQQGSASLLQRKLKLGYNRAGRLIDQLEAAGIVGPFEGSKARSVNIPDLTSLYDFLDNEKQN